MNNVIFDSGTSNVILDTSTAEVSPRKNTVTLLSKRKDNSDLVFYTVLLSKKQAIYSLISSNIKPYSAEQGTYGLPCADVANLSSTISFTFTSTSGSPFNLTIPSEELSVGPFADDSSTCQMLINALDGVSILGASLLKHYYTVWDVGNQQMGFAPNGVVSTDLHTGNGGSATTTGRTSSSATVVSPTGGTTSIVTMLVVMVVSFFGLAV